MIDLPGASPLLCELASRGEPKTYTRGRLLIEEGDFGDVLYLVVSGRLRAFSSDEGGREITYGLYGPGEYVGEMSLDGGPRAASVETVTRSQCIVIGRARLEAFIAERPAFAFELLAKVIARARAATLSARQMALNDVYGRVRLLLESMATRRADGSRGLAEALTHQAMADRIGCSRPMVSRVLKDLERGGIISAASGRMRLLKDLPVRW